MCAGNSSPVQDQQCDLLSLGTRDLHSKGSIVNIPIDFSTIEKVVIERVCICSDAAEAGPLSVVRSAYYFEVRPPEGVLLRARVVW
jgi:hypothetical protein